MEINKEVEKETERDIFSIPLHPPPSFFSFSPPPPSSHILLEWPSFLLINKSPNKSSSIQILEFFLGFVCVCVRSSSVGEKTNAGIGQTEEILLAKRFFQSILSLLGSGIELCK